jgi:hypothetical protein
MQVLMGQILTDLDGKEIPSLSGEPATLRGVSTEALIATFKSEEPSGEEKLKRWELALKVKKSEDPVDLTSDEIVLIKKLIGKAYGPMISGQAWQMLEGK